jgi:hypothetical protein
VGGGQQGPPLGRRNLGDARRDDVVHHFDGTNWSRSQPAVSSPQTLQGIWARNPGDVFAWSESEIHEFDGQTWRLIHSYPTTTPARRLDLHSVHGSQTQLWAVTWDGVVERWDGSTWLKDEQLSTLSSVVRVTARDVWIGAYGTGGGIMRKALSP